MTMITPSYLGETIEYSSLHACRSTLEDPTHAGLTAVTAIAFAALSPLLEACGGSEPPPKAKEPERETAKPVSHGPLPSFSTELGTIDPDEVAKTFAHIQASLMACYADGQKRVEYLSGDVKFFVRVGQDGAARWTFLEESTLGDRDSERCMLDRIMSTRWPQPQGGEAEVQKQIGFDAPGNVRAPAEWSTDRVAATLGKHGDDAMRCKKGESGTFHVTAYVEPAGKGGKVQAVGVAPPNKDAEGKVDCIVDAVKKLKMPSPGSYAAKVNFIL